MSTPHQYSFAILVWHHEHGDQLAAERLSRGALERYKATIERLHALDAYSDESSVAIARAQLEELNWSSDERFPRDLWMEFGLEVRTLGEAARWILRRLREQRSENDTSPIRPDERRTITYTSHEQLMDSARSIYARYTERTGNGIGAVELLVAFALEREEIEGELTFLPPEAYGLEEVPPAAREQDLLDLVRDGVLQVESSAGETVTEEEEARDALPHHRERE